MVEPVDPFQGCELHRRAPDIDWDESRSTTTSSARPCKFDREWRPDSTDSLAYEWTDRLARLVNQGAERENCYAGHRLPAQCHSATIRSLLPAPSNSGKEIIELVDILPQFIGLRHIGPRGRRVVVAPEPSRAFCHRGCDGLAVQLRDVRKRSYLASLHAGSEPLDNAAEELFFQGTLPCFTEKTVYLHGRPLVCVLMSLAVELRRVLEQFPQMPDATPDL